MPPEPIKNVVPDIEVPQVFVVAGNTAARPGITLPRLSVKKETVKSILTIHSKFRNDSNQGTNCKTPFPLTTDFTVDLNEPYL